MKRFFGSSDYEEESEWLSISDMMAGLMVIFMFISIAYISTYKTQNNQIREIAKSWESREEEIYQELRDEFKNDLDELTAEIIKESLLIRFNSPKIGFEKGEHEIPPKFRDILDEFFPRYIRVLTPFKEQGVLEEIRIEGHTSPEWEDASSEEEAYFKNMELSQKRTRAVLKYALGLVAPEDQAWLRKLLTANGLSSSRPVRGAASDPERSRRVEFRVRTKVRSEIKRILDVAR